MTRLKFYQRLTVVSGLVLVLLNHFAFGFLAFFIPTAEADAVTWVGSPSGGFWDNAANWSTGVIPTATDDVVITGDDMFISATSTINFSSLTLAGPDVRFLLSGSIGTGGDLTISESLFIQATSTRQTISGTLTIDDGVMQHLQNTSTTEYKLDFVAENIIIEPGGHVRVDNDGSPGGEIGEDGYGNGGGDADTNGNTGAGGSNAGTGGFSSVTNFGGFSTCSFSAYGELGPTEGGSGGGGSATSTGGDGGGFVRLEANNILTINGRITADADSQSGQNAGEGAGAGSGGSIFLLADTINGTPEAPITARGGNSFDADGGGGGGGCVRVRYATTSTLDGAAIIVDGGVGFENGGAGVVLVEKADESVRNMYITATTTPAYGIDQNFTIAGTKYVPLSGDDILSTLSVSTSSVYVIADSFAITDFTLTGATPFQGSSPSGTVRIQGDVELRLSSGAHIEDVTLELQHEDISRRAQLIDRVTGQANTLDITIGNQGTVVLRNFTSTTPLTLDSFTVGSGGTLTHYENTGGDTQQQMVYVHADDISIESGGVIDVTGKGFAGGINSGSGNGPGGGSFIYGVGVGAGHGGEGTANNPDGTSAGAGGEAYCNASNPQTLGSGGSSGYFDTGTGRPGGNGGGLVWLSATNEITLSGDIYADGENGSYDLYVGDVVFESISGAGAGGGVKLTAPIIGGHGEIFVRGGNNGVDPDPVPSEYGGGAGGCVFINYTSSNSVVSSSVYVAGGGLSAGVAQSGEFSILKENEAPELYINIYKPLILSTITSTIFDHASALAVSGEYAYVGAMQAGTYDGGFHVLDIASSTNPVVIGSIASTAELRGIYGIEVSGEYAFAANVLDNSFKVIDISSSTDPEIVSGIDFVSGNPEFMALTKSGEYAYVVAATDNYSSLRIIDVSSPLTPVVVGTIADDSRMDFPVSVRVLGDYAYVTTLAGQFVIVDISTPASPSIISVIEDSRIFDNSFGVVVEEGYAYVSSADNDSVVVIDISDVSSPEIVKIVEGPASVIDNTSRLEISGEYIYVSMVGVNPGIWVIDISSPLEAHSVGYVIDHDRFSSPLRPVVQEGKLYIVDYSEDLFGVMDISTPLSDVFDSDPSIMFGISDGDRDTLSIKAEYADAVSGSCTYSGTSLATFSTTTVTSTYGINIDNSAGDNRRIASIIIDPLSTYPITHVTTTWLSSIDEPGSEGQYCMFLTPYDGEDEGSRISGMFTIDSPLLSPSIPILSLANRTQTSITLSWDTVGGADYYVVSSTISGVPTETSDTSVTYAGLTENTQYTFQIKAVDSYGNESAYSGTFSATTNAPSGGNGGGFDPPPPPPDTTPTSTITPTTTLSNPSGLILINHGDFYTKSREVTITLNTEFVISYMLSLTPDFQGVSYAPVVSSTVVTLSPGDGEKKVYARFSNSYGIYDAYDVIVLDATSPPSPSFSLTSSELRYNSTRGIYVRKNTSSTTALNPTVVGSAEPLSRIVLTLSSGVMASGIRLASVETFYTETDSQGNWSFTFPNPLQNTNYTLSVASEDAAGNLSSPTVSNIDLGFISHPQNPPAEEPPTEEPPVEETPVTTPGGEESPVDTNEPAEESMSNLGSNGGEESPVDTTESTVAESVVSSVTESAKVVTQSVSTFFTDLGESLESIPAVKAVTEATKAAVEKTKEVIDNPAVEKTNEVVVAPVIAAAAAVNVVVGGTSLAAELMMYARLIFSQPLLLLKRRKQKKWGVVFNAYTKMPVDLATVRLLRGNTKQITRTQVTDTKGRYFMVANPGEYTLETHKEGYTPHKMSTSEDSVYPNLYNGGPVEVGADAHEINYNIPLELVIEEKTNQLLLKEYSRKIIQKTGSLLGTVATIGSFVISPKPWITALLLLHLFLYGAMKRLSHQKIKGTHGVVMDTQSRKPLSKVVIRIFDATYNKLVETAITDSNGRYAILVGPSTYYLTAEKQGYELYKSDTIDFSSEKTKGTGGIIAKTFTLSKVQEKPSINEKKEQVRVRTMPMI